MRWLLIMLWLAGPGWAETITVTSGEHDGYSRLVLALPEGADWQVGRTTAGYELSLTGNDVRFDVSRVFDLIPKTRLTGLFADPSSGRLQMSLSCLCHALPFQLDPRTLVIDLRDGPAPSGSSFEMALDGSRPAPLTADAAPRPRSRPVATPAAMAVPSADGAQGPTYDWLASRVIATDVAPPVVPVAGPLRAPDPELDALRDTLIRQLSRGAADGVIELALPEGEVSMPAMLINPQMRVTKVPGLAVQTERTPAPMLQPDGMACFADSILDLAAWGGEGDVASQITMARAALVGEFDKPDQAAVAQSVRMQLHLGFGAEAELTIAAFQSTDTDVPMWISLARIMDGRIQTTDAFAGMQGCDTAAALWAVLAAPDDLPVTDANFPAVQRAFSALPVHLRLQLAPQLAARAVAMGHEELARAVTAATNRVTEMPDGAQAILQARVDMAAGEMAKVATAMEAVLAEAGPSAAEALILLVEARVALAEPMAPEIPDVAAALLREYAGTDLEPDLQHAWLLSMGAAGDFDGVFDAAPDAASMPDIWRLLAHIGTDEAVLTHGILPVGAPVTAKREAAVLMAERLVGLGFAEPAAQWMGRLPDTAPDTERMLMARIDLARGDGRAVLASLAGRMAPEELVLKAQAEQSLGQPDLASVTWAAAGDPVASLQTAGWAQDWTQVAAGTEGAWQAAAKTVTELPTPVTGPLAQGRALVDESAAVRASLDVLLATVPQP
jgi:hypothetical protein